MKSSFWHKAPIARILLPFALGITTSMFLSCSFTLWTLILIAGVLTLVLFRKILGSYTNKWIEGVILCTTFYAFGISLHQYQNELFRPDHFSHQQSKWLVVRITDPPVSKAKSYKLKGEVLSGIDSTNQSSVATGNLLIYVLKDSIPFSVSYGDIVLLEHKRLKEVPPPQNPGEFNYRRYLAFNNIHYQATLSSNALIQTGTHLPNSFFVWIYDVQQYFKSVLSNSIQSASETGVAQALLYGYDDEIDSETVKAYANTGTLHVLAVSGMHVGIIFMVLGWILGFMDKNRKIALLKHLTIIISLWLYSFLCGLSPSILRATVMFTFIIVGQMLNRSGNIYNTLAASAFFLLCVDTNMLANTGFQLSYMAVIGIVFLQPLIYDWFSPRTYLMNEVWKITSVSIAAQITTSPLSLLYFHQFPNCFLFSNLIIIPLTTVILYAGIVLLIFSKIPIVVFLLGKGIFYTIVFTNSIVKLVEQMPYAYVEGIQINILQCALLYVLASCLITFFMLNRAIWLKSALVVSICFFVIQALHSIENDRQQSICIYRVNGKNAIHFIQQNESLLLVDSSLWADKSKVRFHMQQHFWQSGISKQQVMYTDNKWKLITFNSKKILLTGENKILPVTDISDILVITNKKHPKDMGMVPAKMIVSTSAVNTYSNKKLKTLAKEKQMDFYSVSESGAFQLSLY